MKPYPTTPMFRGFFAAIPRSSCKVRPGAPVGCDGVRCVSGALRGPSDLPAVRVPDGDHRGEDVVPGLRLHHDLVGEHAAVPADVAEPLGQAARLVAEPEPGDVGDVQLTLGVV